MARLDLQLALEQVNACFKNRYLAFLAGAGAAASGAAGAGAAAGASAGAAAAGAGAAAAGAGASAASLGAVAQVAGRIPAAMYPITIPVMMLVVYGSEYLEGDEKKETVVTKSIIEKRRERLAKEQCEDNNSTETKS